ncbi:hypothetical protein OG840_02205 [Streptomyces sp. NBC_01764]|uniref:hypothetical protein n=1 Tax=Streptomyces sp. NBC_01764 TaxID=2975935 RepID=UPI00224F36F1|nr:hypothetical protein [Streptomyces sp. NBC_01764]MCX4400640.1 hypothetical protein [Streptomyces sp. NBC_01764]
MTDMSALRRLGFDAATGKPAYVLPEPGGFLDTMADVAALEAATVWHSLAETMTEGPQLSAEEANFVLARVVEALGEILPVAARGAEAMLAPYSESARDIGAALRGMKP